MRQIQLQSWQSIKEVADFFLYYLMGVNARIIEETENHYPAQWATCADSLRFDLF